MKSIFNKKILFTLLAALVLLPRGFVFASNCYIATGIGGNHSGANGHYTDTGRTFNTAPVYNNGTYNLFLFSPAGGLYGWNFSTDAENNNNTTGGYNNADWQDNTNDPGKMITTTTWKDSATQAVIATSTVFASETCASGESTTTASSTLLISNGDIYPQIFFFSIVIFMLAFIITIKA